MVKKTMVAVAALLAAVFAFAQDAELVKVRGKGTGADRAEALKDAYRDAVERAVGLYVDAEQMMKNEELVKDQILTQSNAYIEKYDVAKETTKPNGLVEVQILAEVRKRKLAQKISDVMPEKKYALSDGLKDTHAKLTTQEKRNADGAALLEKALNEMGNPLLRCIDCSLTSPEAVVGRIDESRDNSGPDDVQVNYLFKFKIDRQRFFDNVAKPLKEVLDQVAVAEPQEVSIQANVRSTCNVSEVLAAAREAADESNPRRRHSALHTLRRGTFDDEIIIDVLSAGEQNRLSSREIQVLLVTGVNKHGTVYQAWKYILDKDCSKFMRDWYKRVNDWRRPSVRFNMHLLDADGEVIFTDQINFHPGIDGRNIWGVVQIAPWLESRFYNRSGGVALGKYEWQKFRLPKKTLPEVKDMKIEIAK